MCNQANTTLLGPAKSLEVLQEPSEDGSGKEVSAGCWGLCRQAV